LCVENLFKTTKLANKTKKRALTIIDTPIHSETKISFAIIEEKLKEYFQPKIDRKNRNIQPGQEKQHSYIKKKLVI